MELLSLKRAAEIAGCEQSTLRHAIKRGALRATKPGHDWIVTRQELDRWIAQEPHGSRKRPLKNGG